MTGINFESIFNFSIFNADPSAPSSTQDKTARIALIVLEAAVVAAAALVISIATFNISPIAGFVLIPLVAAGALVGWKLYKSDEKTTEVKSEDISCTSSDSSQSQEKTIPVDSTSTKKTPSSLTVHINSLLERCTSIGQLRSIKNTISEEQQTPSLSFIARKEQSIIISYHPLSLDKISENEVQGEQTLEDFFKNHVLSSSTFSKKINDLLLEAELTIEKFKVAIDLCSCLTSSSYLDSLGEEYYLPSNGLILSAFKRAALGVAPLKILDMFSLESLEKIGIFSEAEGASYRLLLGKIESIQNKANKTLAPKFEQTEDVVRKEGAPSMSSITNEREELEEELIKLKSNYQADPAYQNFFAL